MRRPESFPAAFFILNHPWRGLLIRGTEAYYHGLANRACLVKSMAYNKSADSKINYTSGEDLL